MARLVDQAERLGETLMHALVREWKSWQTLGSRRSSGQLMGLEGR